MPKTKTPNKPNWATMRDPENFNNRRADAAQDAIDAFTIATRCNDQDAVGDLLDDLAHLCDRSGIDFAHELARAILHYRAESPDGRQFTRIAVEVNICQR